MKLVLQNQVFSPLKIMISIGLMMLAFQTESNASITHSDSSEEAARPERRITINVPINEAERKDSTSSADASNPTSQADVKKRIIPKDITKRCSQYCQNLVACQKNEELNAKCFAQCPKSGCVKRGKKPESTGAEPK